VGKASETGKKQINIADEYDFYSEEMLYLFFFNFDPETFWTIH